MRVWLPLRVMEMIASVSNVVTFYTDAWSAGYGWSRQTGTIPVDTWRTNNVIMTPKRRRDVVLTSWWRCYCVGCPLGCHFCRCLGSLLGWVGLWGFLWAPSAKRKDHHGVSSGWSSTGFHSNTCLSGTYEQIPIIFGVRLFWRTPFFFRSITFWRFMVKLYFICWNYSLSSGCHIIAAQGLVSWKDLVKWLQIHYVNWSRVFFSNVFFNLMGALTFLLFFFFNSFFFLNLIVACRFSVIYVREGNDSNV